MIFKKPYAFFIKYFRVINLLLVILFTYLGYKLNLIRELLNNIYNGTMTNYSNLNALYIGFKMYFLLSLIICLIGIIILLFKKKNKPLKDYLYSIIYIIIIIIYLLFVSNIFFTLSDTIIEQTSLRLYRDIAFIIIIPIIYFIIKFTLIVFGFNIKKFNFTQDIIDLKTEEKDNEEVELIFDKNTYKYKRKIRKTLRELKYYFLENKIFITIILSIISIVTIISLFSINIFDKNNVKIRENFNAAGFNYIVSEVYETIYDNSSNIIKEDSKFVIVKINVKNINNDSQNIDFKRLRLFYNKEYIYSNNYFNKYFSDLGKPYNNESLKSGENNEFIFIFKVPKSYKKNKYILKFYDRISMKDEEIVGSYKEVKLTATKLDKDFKEKNININENILFNKSKYGNSNITISKYDIKGSYVYNKDGKNHVIRSNDINKKLLILDYKLEIDKESFLKDYFNNEKEFFDKFISITYNYNGKEKKYNDVSYVGNIDGKVMLSVPFEIKNATSLNLHINFRDVKIIYKLK